MYLCYQMLDWLLGMHEVQGDVLSVKTKNYLKGKILGALYKV